MLAQGRREREGLSQCDAAGHRLLEALRHGQARSKVVLWFYLGVLYTTGRANGLRLGWKANTPAPNAEVHGSPGCACSAIWLGPWGTAVDRYGPSGRKDGSISIDLMRSCTRSVQAETQRPKGLPSQPAAEGGE